jgi:2-polyprenyl-3-methyl-5-hydroxy-6-metoxy-1,4-benzoquinol methylase
MPDPNAAYRRYNERNKRLARRLSLLRAYADRVLDVGAGAGHVAESIRDELRATVVCVEADLVAVKRLTQLGFEVHSSIEEVRGSFDLILLIEVIEHLDDPLLLLRALREHLMPDGRIFLTTPCGRLRSGSIKTNAYDTPEHVQFFTERSLCTALLSAGFSAPRFVLINELYPEFGLFRRIGRQLRMLVRGPTHLVTFVGRA